MNEFENKYKDYLQEKEELDFIGIHWVFGFENGYAASVLKHKNTDDFEVAVMKLSEDSLYEMCYDTPITDDVIQHIEEEEVVSDIIEQIKNIKKNRIIDERKEESL